MRFRGIGLALCAASAACAACAALVACPGFSELQEPPSSPDIEGGAADAPADALGEASASCPAGHGLCGATCIDLQSDASNCGTCGKTCGEKEECLAGVCAISCKKSLNQPLNDPWGGTWDGLERAAASFAAAKTTCEAVDGRIGRLPTPSELLRVSAVRSATVGQMINTSPLWSLAPTSTTTHVSVKLSDAVTASSVNTSLLHYRCTCPPPLEAAYTGKNCFGPPGAACYPLATDGKRYNIDLEDRAAVSKGAAIWECAFYRGHLATTVQLVEAMKLGIGNGSGAFLLTAGDVRYDCTALVSWTDPATFKIQSAGGVPNANAWAVTTAPYPFRCAGVSYAAGTHPAAIANEFVAARSGYKSDSTDTAALGWPAAHDHCFAGGGHLPTSTELATLIDEGLPNGTGANVWGSDPLGSNGSFYVRVASWVGAPSAFGYAWINSVGTDMTWNPKTPTTNALRCIYYPVDASYTGPAPSACAGGACFPVKLPGVSGATMWFDTADRPADTLLGSMRGCVTAGGRLPSERDLTEAIRVGLPNGSGVFVSTHDFELGSSTTSVSVGKVAWSGTGTTAFTDIDVAASNWSAPSVSSPYRCMWTNELR